MQLRFVLSKFNNKKKNIEQHILYYAPMHVIGRETNRIRDAIDLIYTQVPHAYYRLQLYIYIHKYIIHL